MHFVDIPRLQISADYCVLWDWCWEIYLYRLSGHRPRVHRRHVMEITGGWMDTAWIQEGHGLQHYRGDCFILDVWWTRCGLNTGYVQVLMKIGKEGIIIFSVWELLTLLIISWNEWKSNRQTLFFTIMTFMFLSNTLKCNKVISYKMYEYSN